MMDKNDIIEELKKDLDKKRFEHTLGVAYTAACLAMRYYMNIDKAYMAGLLHDCAKGMSNKERLSYCDKYNLPVSEVEKENPSLLHAKVGSHMAKNKYGIDDEAILSAIYYHTTGRPQMELLEEIIFVADYIEPLRDMDPELKEIREEAFTELRKAIIHIYANTLKHLTKSDKALDPTTQEAYDYYNG